MAKIPPTPIQAKPSGAPGGTVARVRDSFQVADMSPEAALSAIRTLVTDDYPEAQKLAAKAAACFPDHAEIQSAHRVLNAVIGPAGTSPAEPATDDEIEWLRDPPESFRGKWVALSGRKVVAAADKLVDVVKMLKAMNFHDKALVHHVG